MPSKGEEVEVKASPLKLLPFFWKSAVKPSCLFDFEGRDDGKHRERKAVFGAIGTSLVTSRLW
jgi:hypothetical protein